MENPFSSKLLPCDPWVVSFFVENVVETSVKLMQETFQRFSPLMGEKKEEEKTILYPLLIL